MSDNHIVRMINNIELPEVNSPRWLSLENFDGEIWKDIEGFEGKYQVSNFGRVKALAIVHKHMKGYRHCNEMIKRAYKSKLHGYYMIGLGNKSYLVHRIVANSFIPNPNNHPFVNHKDETRTNNTSENLEWCTPEYNMKYSHVNEKRIDAICKPVVQYTIDGKKVAEYKSAYHAGRALSVQPSSIRSCCMNFIGSTKGFIWKYKGDDFSIVCKPRLRRVVQLSLNGQVIKLWSSIKEASKTTNTNENGIIQCCRGKRNKSNNFKWKYYDESE